jgi:hypothetical protein
VKVTAAAADAGYHTAVAVCLKTPNHACSARGRGHVKSSYVSVETQRDSQR